LARITRRLSPWQTVYTYCRRWSQDGTWQAIHDELYVTTRLVSGRHDSPSELIVDSQSVKTANYVHEAVDYDGAKHIKGRKRYTVVDTLVVSHMEMLLYR
jgi:transposase